MGDTLRSDAEALAGRLTAWRRELHRHPEIGFDVDRTAAFVVSRLEALGLELRVGVGRSGVLARISGAGRCESGAVLLRADMDALPIEEEPGRDYGSEVPGRMHACGHDGHTAMLLGAAHLLAGRREALRRDVLLCFQPAEEGLGGARAMIEDGALDWVPVREAYALHLWTPYPAGTVHVRPGPAMAAQDEFTARIVGRGGHGAMPHEAIDPIVAASHAVVALQTAVARSVDPLEAAVVTVGAFRAGDAPNVIPEEARLDGTIRSFRPEVRLLLRRRVTEILDATASAFGCRCELDLRHGYPPVVNDAGAAARVREEAARVVGADAVIEGPPLAAAEDFAYFLERVPGAFALLGAGNAERGITAPHHSPRFDIDESVLPRGAELLARLAL